MSTEVFVGIFTIGGVVLTLLISLMTGAFVAGKHSNRITSLEKRQDKSEAAASAAQSEASKTSAELAGLKATLAALDTAVHDGFARVEKALQSLGSRGRRSTGQAD